MAVKYAILLHGCKYEIGAHMLYSMPMSIYLQIYQSHYCTILNMDRGLGMHAYEEYQVYTPTQASPSIFLFERFNT